MSLITYWRLSKCTTTGDLKELYTSISTLAQKLVLTLLNNEFILKIPNVVDFIIFDINSLLTKEGQD